LAVIQEEICSRPLLDELCLNQNHTDEKRRKAVCHQHKGDDLSQEMK